MLEKYLNILAENCKKNFQEMTKTEVVGVTVKKDERPNEIYAIAKAVSYQNIDNQVEGRFILGFTDEAMAVLVASSISTSAGLPPVTEMGEVASDILGEFINIIMGNTITEWDNLGFRVRFGPPTSLEYGPIKEKLMCDTEVHMIILSLVVGHVVFRVTETSMRKNKLNDKRILIVDDSHMIRGILRQVLTENGAVVETAEDGSVAVEKYQSFHPDLTIMDIKMPTLDGLEAIVQIQTVAPKAKFVILSSSARNDEVITAKMLKVCAYVIKPFKAKEFLSIITKAFD
jgi:CheY-like chemotaxis protein